MPYPISQADTVQPKKRSQNKTMSIAHAKWRWRQCAFGKRKMPLEPFAVPLEVGYLTLCFVASDSIALLNPTNKLIALSLDNLPIIVG